ncbi:MAG TPA: hypothetical protein VFT36_11900 [Methylomirabilota bacterium]|nr:hypothetical protein [Methylomirabilota bacterium]
MPEVLLITESHGPIRSGPQDDIIQVVDAADKDPYRDDATGEYHAYPPYRGLVRPPVPPGPDGHFDHFRPGTREFSATSMFATVRYVRSVWEHHLGGSLDWWFRYTYPRLEVIPRVNSQLGWSGVGFIECGYPRRGGRPGSPPDHRDPFSDNFDIVAHETGHIILKTLIGDPFPRRKPFEYRAHEEAGADLVATLTSLYFDSVVDQLLARTHGDLFGSNTLSRFGELRIPRSSNDRAVRTLFNRETLASVRRTMARSGRETHLYGKPFAGAVFDLLVELYERNLVRQRLIPASLARRSRNSRSAAPALTRAFARCYLHAEAGFKDALLDARDTLGRLLARTWDATSPHGLTFQRVAANLIAQDRRLNGGAHVALIRRLFRARGIAVSR